MEDPLDHIFACFNNNQNDFCGAEVRRLKKCMTHQAMTKFLDALHK